jgi:hypothetical protein
LITELDTSTREALKVEEHDSQYSYRFRIEGESIILDSLNGIEPPDHPMGKYTFNGKEFIRDTVIKKDFFGNLKLDCIVEKDFLILSSTPDYTSALAAVKDASKKLGIPTNLRHLHPDTKEGLSLPLDSCKQLGFDGGPCYLARGRWDDGVYLSIEYSNAYESFADGY